MSLGTHTRAPALARADAHKELNPQKRVSIPARRSSSSLDVQSLELIKDAENHSIHILQHSF